MRGTAFLMAIDVIDEKRQAQELVDRLTPEQLSAIVNLLKVMALEPLSRSLALAPVEDEELTPETAAALDRACASLARGEGVPHEDVLREFGLKK